MIELKSKNLIIKGSGGDYALNKIFDFLDLMGKNFLYLYNGHISTFGSLVKGGKSKFTKSTFAEKLVENLFRVDYIIVESDDFSYYSGIIGNITTVPSIFISKKDQFKQTLDKYFDCVYRVSEDVIDISSIGGGGFGFPKIGLPKLERYIVEDLKSDWKSNLKELRVQFIRDKNLKDLFGEE